MTLLPLDSDASARAIRARLATELGVEVAVIVSDSFGRPWRWGIVDVALGVAGLAPLDDWRGRPDAAGRTMHATVVAVADEIASTAELASGKTSGRPLVLVRGASLPDRATDRWSGTWSCRSPRTCSRSHDIRRTSIDSAHEGRTPDQLVHLARR